MLSHDEFTIIVRILGAVAIGAVIGFERTFHGRPAGFRTHSLVCLASALLMIMAVYQDRWLGDSIAPEPTRVAQGIMTGIGFLGAGMIFKESFTVRGLTTAASVWVTAAIGILIGVGFWFAAIAGAAATLAILAALRWVEAKLPVELYTHHVLRFARDKVMNEEHLRKMLEDYGFSIMNLSSRLVDSGQCFEYRMVLKSHDPRGSAKLSEHLLTLPEVNEFKISPSND
jgi:putative Mg2+ transporter-C (MgtC) family protein